MNVIEVAKEFYLKKGQPLAEKAAMRGLEPEAEQLKKKIEDLRDKINEDKNSVSLSEIVSIRIDFGILVRKYASRYNKIGYPIDPDTGRTEINLNICYFNPELNELLDLVSDVARPYENNIHSKKIGSLINHINARGYTGYYNNPKDPDISQIKREFLCNLVETAYKAIELKEGISSNQYKKLIDNYKRYSDATKTFSYYDDNHQPVYAPQFANEIEPLLVELEAVTYGEDTRGASSLDEPTVLKR